MKQIAYILLFCSASTYAAESYVRNTIAVTRPATAENPPLVKWKGQTYNVYNKGNIASGKMINVSDSSDVIPTPFIILEALQVHLTEKQKQKVLAAEKKQRTAKSDKACCTIL